MSTEEDEHVDSAGKNGHLVSAREGDLPVFDGERKNLLSPEGNSCLELIGEDGILESTEEYRRLISATEGKHLVSVEGEEY